MTIPQNVSVIKKEHDLDLLHYTSEATHPSPASSWKGIVMEYGQVVARSFEWAPTVVTDLLTEEGHYTPYYEATIVRFYRHNGVPRVSTHRQIDISTKKSGIPGSDRSFMKAITEAIASWPRVQNEYQTEEGKGIAFTPGNWESLCIDGICNVFLLVDRSNQVTDLMGIVASSEEEAKLDVPLLLHALSFRDDTVNMVPFSGDITYRTLDSEITEHRLIVPKLRVMDLSEANKVLSAGGAVVSFNPENPCSTTKFVSNTYKHKLDLVGETFNPVHRWHQLMDTDEALAAEYLSVLPVHMHKYSTEEMGQIYERYLSESAEYITVNVMQRYLGHHAPFDKKLYQQVSGIITSALKGLRKRYPESKRPKIDVLNKAALGLVKEALQKLTYSEQHIVHSKVSKHKSGLEKGIITLN